MKVLLTGFGPFPGVPDNRSQAIVEMLARDDPQEYKLHAHTLPTEYGAASARIAKLLATLSPEVCICLGVSAASTICLETTAHNCDTSDAPDAVGVVSCGSIVPAGPPAHPSTLPLDDIRAALLQAGFDVASSDDAGGYVCNHVFFLARHHAERLGKPAACGFVHIPGVQSTPQGPAPMSLDRIRDAVRVIVSATVRRVRESMPPPAR
jgi:pyroglutamyl-peptidase